MKITVKTTRQLFWTVTACAGLGLSGCTPVALPYATPQGYPMQRPAQAQHHRHIPQAGALQQGGSGAAVRPAAPAAQVNPAAIPVVRPNQHASRGYTNPTPRNQQRIPVVQPQHSARGVSRGVSPASRVEMPPELRPAQNTVTQRQPLHAARPTSRPSASRPSASRPSASVSRKPVVDYRESAPAVKNVPEKRTRSVTVSRPSASVRKPPPAPETKVAKKPSANTQTPPPGKPAKPAEQKNVVISRPSASVKPDKPIQKSPPLPPLPASKTYSSSPAVSVLIKQANNDLSAGKHSRAAATLERALRIAPDDALLWLRLAEVNEQQGNRSQAASMARKAIGLAPEDENLKQRGQRLLN